ncbi:hypothetical protein N658DRAFT_498793 [Parathielavia hyrcaniae]|uniref:Uncharacterized protein n=1 Tax=Parathielavia hyrcaniae TaxID=113614 RepID=A0AAN6PVZ6_9PEZI|nr:hypothetical protein N658DRAFT_498793 [Parathielavia hyrcaniae]
MSAATRAGALQFPTAPLTAAFLAGIWNLFSFVVTPRRVRDVVALQRLGLASWQTATTSRRAFAVTAFATSYMSRNSLLP